MRHSAGLPCARSWATMRKPQKTRAVFGVLYLEVLKHVPEKGMLEAEHELRAGELPTGRVSAKAGTKGKAV